MSSDRTLGVEVPEPVLERVAARVARTAAGADYDRSHGALA